VREPAGYHDTLCPAQLVPAPGLQRSMSEAKGPTRTTTHSVAAYRSPRLPENYTLPFGQTRLNTPVCPPTFTRVCTCLLLPEQCRILVKRRSPERRRLGLRLFRPTACCRKASSPPQTCRPTSG